MAEADLYFQTATGFTAVSQATPLPVTAGESYNVLAYAVSTSATANTGSSILVAAGTATRTLTLTNGGAAAVWLNPTGGLAVVGAGLMLAANGGSLTFGPNLPIPQAAITAIVASGTSLVAIAGA